MQLIPLGQGFKHVSLLQEATQIPSSTGNSEDEMHRISCVNVADSIRSPSVIEDSTVSHEAGLLFNACCSESVKNLITAKTGKGDGGGEGGGGG